MSSGVPNEFRMAVSDLVKDPDDMTDPDNNFGGTVLGDHARLEFRPGLEATQIIDEYLGGGRTEVIYGAGTGQLFGVLRGWDADALQAFFSESVIGPNRKRQVIEMPQDLHPRRLGSDRAFKLLVAPRDTENSIGLMIYRAAPVIDVGAVVHFTTDRESVFQVHFDALPDGSSRWWAMGPVEDLSL